MSSHVIDIKYVFIHLFKKSVLGTSYFLDSGESAYKNRQSPVILLYVED